LSSFAKRSGKKNETLETKVLVRGKMEAGEKHANVCSSLNLALATLSKIMANAEEIKGSI
jgi:hypothetical protein